ncbi:MAG: RIP metalloprotease RseP [Flavobacteriales bacterium]
MDVLIKVAQLILSLSVLVVLHELGHFIPAKLFGTRVEKFFLFFDAGFSLFKVKRGETTYGVGWIPLGGYVKLSGMVDESMDTEQLDKEPEPYEFRSKPAWQRLIIMVGGVAVNVLLGFFIYAMILNFHGERYLPNDSLKDGIWVTSDVGKELGFRTGDKILTINGDSVERFKELQQRMLLEGGTVTVSRDGNIKRIELPKNLMGMASEEREPFFMYRMPFFLGKVPDSSINRDAGLQKGDRIVSMGGKKISYIDQGKKILKERAGQQIKVGLVRKKDTLQKELTVNDSGLIEVKLAMATPKQLERLGIYERRTKHYGFFASFPAGWNKTVEELSKYARMFGSIFLPETGAIKGMGGFGSIANIFPPTWDWLAFWRITALLSLILAFMNFLPIPALDGGHVMFLLYEMVAGRPPGRKFMEIAQIVGMIIILSLLLYANGMDVVRWLEGNGD